MPQPEKNEGERSGSLMRRCCASVAMPEKIVIGTLPINAAVTAYLGDVDYFTGEGLTVELFHGPNGPAVVQALVSGSLPLGDIGLSSAIIAGELSNVRLGWLQVCAPIICPASCSARIPDASRYSC